MDSPEIYFLKYAVPCGQIAVDVLKNLDQETLDRLAEKIVRGNAPSREEIEASFPAAFERLKRLAKKMGVSEYWDIRVLEEYWNVDHNDVIERGEGNYSWFPPFLKEYCKVHVSKVIENKGEGFFEVQYFADGKKYRALLPVHLYLI